MSKSFSLKMPQACYKGELKRFLLPLSPRKTAIEINRIISENRNIPIEEATKNVKVVLKKEVIKVLEYYGEEE